MTAADVLLVIGQAAQAVDTPISVAVVDRVGNILGVFSRGGATAADEEIAVSKARTGAFFSHDQGPLSSELIRFLSRENFPEDVRDTPAADLFGIELTNRGCPLTSNNPAGGGQFPYLAGQAVPPSRNIANTGPGLGIGTTPGGFPLYKNNREVGGVGVHGSTPIINEFAALTAITGFGLAAPDPGKIYLEGIILPFTRFFAPTDAPIRPAGVNPGAFPGGGVFRALPDFVAIGTSGSLGYATAGTAIDGVAVQTRGSPITAAPFAPEGYLIGPNAGTQLTAAEVDLIVQRAIEQSNRTRAAIRLPPGQRCKMIFAVAEGIGNCPGQTGTANPACPPGTIAKGTLLALFRMTDATIFSLDVAVAKSRNVVYFSDPARFPDDLPGVPPGTAVSSRTISFGSQTMYPSGILNSGAGPFRNTFLFDQANPCTNGQDPNEIYPDFNESGIVFFPGGTALYKNGVMVGGFGASGDGVAQDDVITEFGARPFQPPDNIRADNLIVRNVRLPYYKFSRNPEE